MSDWPNYLIRQDFTVRGKMLAALPVGVLDELGQRTLAAVLNECGPDGEKDKWSLDPTGSEFSLVGAEIVYNGPNKYSLPTFSFFKYALGLKFPARSKAPTGSIYLCWYEPSDVEPDITPPGPGEPPIDPPYVPDPELEPEPEAPNEPEGEKE